MRKVNKIFSGILVGTVLLFGLIWLNDRTNVNTVNVVTYDAVPYAKIVSDYNF